MSRQSSSLHKQLQHLDSLVATLELLLPKVGCGTLRTHCSLLGIDIHHTLIHRKFRILRDIEVHNQWGNFLAQQC